MSGRKRDVVNNVGYDPGFGNSKAAAVFQSSGEGPEQELTLTMRTAVVPSVVGVGDTDMGLLGRAAFGRRRRRKPFEVMFEGLSYLVGHNVADYARRPAQRMDFNRLADGPELRALLYATLYDLLKAGQHTVNIMIGLPVEVMKDRTAALSTLRSLRRWLVCTHDFTVNGDPISLTVEQVAAAEQPAGAWYAWGVDNAGRWARRGASPMSQVAVCDPGFNTLDLWTISGGMVTGAETDGDTVGMRRAAEILIQRIRAEHNVKLSLHEADALVTARKPVLHIAAGDIPIRDLVDQALDATAANIHSFISSLWEQANQLRHVLLVGGGAEIPRIRKALLEDMPLAVVLPNPVTANAVGLARLAQRQFKAK